MLFIYGVIQRIGESNCINIIKIIEMVNIFVVNKRSYLLLANFVYYFTIKRKWKCF
jgi:hypothetical protein